MVFLLLFALTFFSSPLPPLPIKEGTLDRSAILESMIYPMYGGWPRESLVLHSPSTQLPLTELKSIQYEIVLNSPKDQTRSLRLIHIVPENHNGKTILTLNKCGNHTLHPSPHITPSSDVFLHPTRCKESTRGSDEQKYDLSYVLSQGYSFASFAESDMAPDSAVFQNSGIKGLYSHDWGVISAWAWGLSQSAKVLREQGFKQITVTGHSRQGKAALLAAALDQSISGVITHQSGLGGTASLRDSWWRESAAKMMKGFFVYPLMGEGDHLAHFFTDKFQNLAEHPTKLSFDAHHLIALVAPRRFVDVQGAADFWAGPLSAKRMQRAVEHLWQTRGPAHHSSFNFITLPTFHTQNHRFWMKALEEIQ